MFKNVCFWNKNVKITSVSGAWPPAAGRSAPKPPRYYSSLLLQICREFISSAKCILLP